LLNAHRDGSSVKYFGSILLPVWTTTISIAGLYRCISRWSREALQ